MKKYLIVTTSTGTQTNPNFAGVTKTMWSGKGHLSNIDRTVFESDYSDEREYFKNRAIHRLAQEYGYDSIGSCKRAIAVYKKHTDEETSRFNYHTFEHDILCLEVTQLVDN